MKVNKFGEIVVSQRNNEPHIEIRGFEVEDGSASALRLFALRYAMDAVWNGTPWPWRAEAPKRSKPKWRYVLSFAADVAAVYCAWVIHFAASGSYTAATGAAVAVGLYGLWCFLDGSN